MIVNTTSFGDTSEILASDNYTAIPIRLQNSSTTYKTGTPITSAGVAALDGTNAVGILLFDVDTSDNPNGTIVVAGVINYSKLPSTVTATASTLHTAIPAIYFREDVGIHAALSLSVTTLALTAASGTTHTGTSTVGNATGTVAVASSDTTKATVAISGTTVTVTGVAAGSATITVSDAVGCTATIEVTVS